MGSKVPHSKKIVLSVILLFYAGCLAMVVNNMQDRDLVRNLVMFAVPTLLFALVAYYTIRLSLKEFLFVLIPMAVVAVILEIGFIAYLHIHPDRAPELLWGHGDDLGDYFVYRPHHYTLYTLKEGYRNDFGTVHNAQGFRNTEDLADEKPPCEFRIFFLGGSSTYTVGIKDNKEIFTSKLESALNLEARRRGVDIVFRVINAGMGGATSAENLSRLIYLITPYKPDLLVIQHGFNDVLPRLQGTIQSDYSNYRRMWCTNQNQYDFFLKRWMYNLMTESKLLTFAAVRLNLVQLNTILGKTVKSGEARLENLHRNQARYFRRNTELMVLVARHSGSDVILASCPFNEKLDEARLEAMPEHNRITRETAEKMGARFFDLYNSFDRGPQYLPDGLHVTRKGSDLKQELYLDFLLDSYRLFDEAAIRVGSECLGSGGN